MDLFDVSENIFHEYVKKHNLKEVQGRILHSSDFIDEFGEVKAYMETSSWSMTVIYRIADLKYQNLETLELFTSLLNH